MDLSSSYWQVGVHPDDQDKTAFVTCDGLYNFKVMPYGLCNSGATFEHLMELVLAGLHWTTCLLYVDDIICFSTTVSEHISRLDEILSRIRDSGLKLSAGKCKLFQMEVAFLGNLVSQAGIRTYPEKIKAVKEWPVPRNVHEVRSFLGTASYYRSFCKSFCDVARPLHKLIEKKSTFIWDEECDKSFNELKRLLTSAPILGYPRSDSEYLLDCDCCGYGLGAVLSQKQNGVERVISYYSKSLSKAEQNFCVTRRELLSVVSAVKHYHHHLFGVKFTIRTDHSALRWLLKTFRDPEGQISRWIEVLSTYNFEIEHRVGRLHGNCDGLPRIPCNYCPNCKCLQEKEKQGAESGCSCESVTQNKQSEPAVNKLNSGQCPQSSLPSPENQATEGPDNAKSYRRVTTRSQTKSCTGMKEWLKAKTTEDIVNEQAGDIRISTVIAWKTASNVRPIWESVSHLDKHYKSYWSQWNRLLIKDNILYRKWICENTGREHLELVVPETWQNDVLKMFHSDPGAGHMGVKRTVE